MITQKLHKLFTQVTLSQSAIFLLNDSLHQSPSAVPHETLPGIIAHLDMCQNIYLEPEKIQELKELNETFKLGISSDDEPFLNQDPHALFSPESQKRFIETLKKAITDKVYENIQETLKDLIEKKRDSLDSPETQALADKKQSLQEEIATKESHRPTVASTSEDAYKKLESEIATLKEELKQMEKEYQELTKQPETDISTIIKRKSIMLIQTQNQLNTIQSTLGDQQEELSSHSWQDMLTHLKLAPKEMGILETAQFLRRLIELYPIDAQPSESNAAFHLAEEIKILTQNWGEQLQNYKELLGQSSEQEIAELLKQEMASTSSSSNSVESLSIYQVTTALEDIESLVLKINAKTPPEMRTTTLAALPPKPAASAQKGLTDRAVEKASRKQPTPESDALLLIKKFSQECNESMTPQDITVGTDAQKQRLENALKYITENFSELQKNSGVIGLSEGALTSLRDSTVKVKAQV